MIYHTLFGVALVAILLLTALFWLWMLTDCVGNKSISGIQKIVWFLLIFFTYLPGAIAYFLIGHSTHKVANRPEGQSAP